MHKTSLQQSLLRGTLDSSKRSLPLIALLTCLLLLPISSRAQSNSEKLQKFFADSFEEQLKDSPESATSIGRHDYDDRWTDFSTQGRTHKREHLQKELDLLKTIPLDNVSEQDRLSVRLFQYDTVQQLEAEDVETHLLRISQVYGLHNRIYLTIDRMPAHNVHEYENIIARLHGIPAYVDQNIAILNESLERGLVQPRNVVDLTEKQIAAQIAQDASKTALLAAFRKFPSNISEQEQKRLLTSATTAYEKEFLPSWKKLHDFIAGPYAAKARPSVGLGGIPNGQDYYAILVRRYTTTSFTPAQIHKIGEDELKRIEGEMIAITRETGFNGTLPEFEAKMNAMPEQHFQSKEEMLVYCRNIAKLVEPELPNQFRHIPIMLYGVRAIPEDREAATPTNAQSPSPDGSTPGWFNLNTYQPEKQMKSNKESLVLHEAVPGHVFQGSVAHAITGIPEFRKFYGNSAYAEGWALYVESLGKQLGLYNDPYSRYGQLSSERFRAVRLVVDTGIHSMGWTREQAVEYFHAHVPDQSLAEIDRYIAWPGQALSYKMGQLKIMELRREAEKKLGSKFDVRDFHDVILRNGALPLDLLEEQGQKYIASAN